MVRFLDTLEILERASVCSVSIVNLLDLPRSPVWAFAWRISEGHDVLAACRAIIRSWIIFNLQVFPSLEAKADLSQKKASARRDLSMKACLVVFGVEETFSENSTDSDSCSWISFVGALTS